MQTFLGVRHAFLPHERLLNSNCLQISAGDHMQIFGDPIGVVEVKVLTSQTHIYVQAL